MMAVVLAGLKESVKILISWKRLGSEQYRAGRGELDTPNRGIIGPDITRLPKRKTASLHLGRIYLVHRNVSPSPA
jgi:hypothetical protein